MSDTLIERTRNVHADIEKTVAEAVEDIIKARKTNSHKETLLRDHRTRRRIDAIRAASRELIATYEDAGGARQRELAAMSGDDVFSSYYARLKATRDYHRKHPGASVRLDAPARPQGAGVEEDDGRPDETPAAAARPAVRFSAEENYGKYVDMHDLYKRYTNLRVVGDQCNYYTFLGRVQKLDRVARDKKMGSHAYRAYARDLLAYMSGFFKRRHPLADAEDFKRQILAEFEKKWDDGKVEGWMRSDVKGRAGGSAKGGDEDDEAFDYAPVDLSKVETAKDLEDLGMEYLKAELRRVGLKAGGRLQDRAKRLFMLKGKTIDQISKKHRSKASLLSTVDEGAKPLACTEFQIRMYYELLRPEMEATREYIEKKLTKTYEEIQAERDQDSDDVGEESDDEVEGQIYNPLKVPLGFDGKPIPFWLYKLHGLNVEYKCEICGNYSYWGPRAFARHFNESRHAFGMQCLGITMSKEFENITLIEDALTLNRKLQRQARDREWKPEEEEEFEDKDGNVYDKKTFDDLKRQGLV